MKKIMFNDKYGLTKAVLEGRKTMTRRLFCLPDRAPTQIMLIDGVAWVRYGEEEFIAPTKCQPRYKVGEVVAVAQSYESIYDEMSCNYTDTIDNVRPLFEYFDGPGYDNKMFVKADLMPHQIRITNVRVERLQDISDGDVYKEGFSKEAVNNGWGNYAYHYEAMLVYYDKLGRSKEIRSRTPREAFAALIDKVSGKGTWAKNPFVFVYEFELIK